MKPDMSPEAVTSRLRAVGELRRLCLSLRQVEKPMRHEIQSERTGGGESIEARPDTREPSIESERADDHE